MNYYENFSLLKIEIGRTIAFSSPVHLKSGKQHHASKLQNLHWKLYTLKICLSRTEKQSLLSGKLTDSY